MKRARGTALAAVFLCALAQAATSVRESSVAGSFYPADAPAVAGLIQNYLSAVPEDAIPSGTPALLITPHAGLVYSGQTSAYAFKGLEGRRYDTVILIGVCHRAALAGASVWTDGVWRTPLGDVPVDTPTARAIAAADGSLRLPPSAHAKEHSLEVPLLFLQSVLKDLKIVPILISDPSERFTDTLAAAVSRQIKDKNALVVISTDLSHYRPDAAARVIDARATQMIESGDSAGLRRTARAGGIELCGLAPVLTGLAIARQMGWSDPVRAHYSTSADSAGSPGSVVGYLAAVGMAEPPRAPLGRAQREALLAIARRALDRHVRFGERPEAGTSDPALLEERGVFVSLYKKGALRGCIGHIVGTDALASTVSRMTVAAASEDPRFTPVRPEELADITLEISVLSPLERVNVPGSIVPGRHGILLKNGRRQGVFLPQVATETGWTRERLLNELCTQKAGLAERCWEDADSELYVFTAEMIK